MYICVYVRLLLENMREKGKAEPASHTHTVHSAGEQKELSFSLSLSEKFQYMHCLYSIHTFSCSEFYLSPLRLLFMTCASATPMLFNFVPILIIFLFSSTTPSLSSQPLNSEVLALTSIKSSLIDPHNVLSNWDDTSVDPCSWAFITCSPQNQVTVLEAPSQSLAGPLSAAIGNLTNLQQVLLQDNNVTGEIPAELGKLPKLKTLDLSNNKLSGPIPDSLGQLSSLQYLRLNNNTLIGGFPLSLAKIPQLIFLDLSYNNLSGPVPTVPARTFNIQGNLLTCGSRSTHDCSPSTLSSSLSSPPNASQGKLRGHKVAVAVGSALGCTSATVLVLALFVWWKKKQSMQIIRDNYDQYYDEEMLCLGNLKRFSFRELQAATDNFNSKRILGKGGFGNVYKGYLQDGTIVAVKRLKDCGDGETQFQTEIEMISLAVHRNLLRLLGFCITSSERLLVYPFMSNGSVASRLRVKPTLDWNTRKSIALGAARGLVYLHEQCDPKIIHRDVKAANILLDDYCEAVVGDFGLAKLIDHRDSHVTTVVRGTVGHIAPEYLSTGQSSEKTDIYGFGILLLELITGQTALDFGNKAANQKGAMLDWVKKMHQDKNLDVIVDKDLGGNYDRIEAREMIQVALLCTQYLPINRPKMSEVVKMLAGDGLAHKWEASHDTNDSNSTESDAKRKRGSNKRVSSPSFNADDARMIVMTDNGRDGDSDDDDCSSFDTQAIELSGPR